MESRDITLTDLAHMIGNLQSETQALTKRVNALQSTIPSGFVASPSDSDAGPSFPTSGAVGFKPTAGVPVIQVASPATLPLAPPERYYGDPLKFASFVSQCQLHFMCKPMCFPDEQSKVAFVLSYLGGTASTWSIPLIERDDPLLYDYVSFKVAFKRLFDRHSFIQSADTALLNLRQGNTSLLTYISSFNRLITETNWPEDKRSTLFYRGLREELKDMVAQIVNPPDTCCELIELVVKLDHRLFERRREKQRSDSRPSVYRERRSEPEKTFDEVEPMQIGSIRGPLTEEERKKRRSLGLCLYCGQKGHFLRDCTVKPKRREEGLNYKA